MLTCTRGVSFHVGRLLMLGGAELILAPLSLNLAHLSHSDPLGATNLQRVCQTRAFENVAAVACVVPAKSTSTAEDPTATPFSSRLELLGSQSHTANRSSAAVFTAAVPLGMLRQTRRGGSIWGDAYRRPYDYRELCGFAPALPPPVLGEHAPAFLQTVSAIRLTIQHMLLHGRTAVD